jgi:hypothetical protein
MEDLQIRLSSHKKNINNNTYGRDGKAMERELVGDLVMELQAFEIPSVLCIPPPTGSGTAFTQWG